MVEDYKREKEHAMQMPVMTHHGVAAEAIFRKWLSQFLPQRYGVTSGYIRGQRIEEEHSNRHFDVIIYDQLESPVLWTEGMPGTREQGLKRMIPAEYVTGVIEVKARLTCRSASDAVAKLGELGPLTASVDGDEERYPTYLPRNCVLACVFFEVMEADRASTAAVQALYTGPQFNRAFYGGLVLSGEGLPLDATGITKLLVGDRDAGRPQAYGDLLTPHCLISTEATGIGASLVSLDWMDTNFASFAFDLLAIMRGKYERGRVSSFHLLDFSKFKLPSGGGA